MKLAWRILRRSARLLFWTFVSLLILLLLINGAILLPPVQQVITDKAASFVMEKTGTHVSVDKLFIGFPKEVVIKGLYVEDQQADTLAYLGQLKLDIDLLDLLDNELNISNASIQDLTAHIHRSRDSTFNFMFIPEAFASEDKAPTEPKDSTSSGGFSTNLEKVLLNDLYGSFHDEVSGLEIRWDLGRFSAALNEMDLEKLLFDIDDVQLANTSVDMIQRAPPYPSPESTDTTSSDLVAKVNSLKIENSSWTFDDQEYHQNMGVEIGSFELTPASFHLLDEKIIADEITLRDSHYYLDSEADSTATNESDNEPSETPTNPLEVFPWMVQVNQLDIQNQSFRLTDHNQPKTPGAFNAAHMDFKDIAVQLSDLDYSADGATLKMNRVALVENNSGVQLDDFSASISLDSSQAEAGDLILKTPNSSIALNAVANYTDYAAISDHPENIEVVFRIEESDFQLRDLLPFAPDLEKQFPPLAGDGMLIHLDSDIDGTLADLTVHHLRAAIDQRTKVNISGNVKGLPDAQTAHYDVKISELRSGRKALAQLLPPNSLPESIRVPESFNLTGDFNGTLNAFDTDLAFSSSTGDLELRAEMDMPADSLPVYQAQLETDNLDLSKLLVGADTLGMVSMQFDLRGKGMELDNAVAELEGEIRSIEFRQKTYENVNIHATADKKVFDAEVSLKDSLVNFALKACADLAAETPYYRAELDLVGIDLFGMGFTTEDFRVSGQLQAQAVGDSLNQINAHLTLADVLFIREGEQYPMDSVIVELRTRDDLTHLALQSGVMKGDFNSNIPLDSLQGVVMAHVDHYYHLIDSTDLRKPNNDHFFEFAFDVQPTPVFKEVLVPELTNFSPGTITGEFRQQTDIFNVAVFFPSITYQSIVIDSLDFTVQSDADSLKYILALREVGTAEYAVSNARVYGNLAEQQLLAALDIRDSLDQKSLYLGGKFRQHEGDYRFSFVPDGVIINKESWDVPEDHYLEFGKQGVLAKNMQFRNGEQEVRVESESLNYDVPMNLTFDGFELADLAQAVDYEKDLVSGRLNGSVNLTFPDSITRFKGDLKIVDLHLMGSEMGDFALEAENTPETIELLAKLSGSDNDVQVDGRYRFSPDEKLDFTADIRRFDSKTIAPFTKDHLDSLSGSLSGNIQVTGSTTSPQFEGELTFNDFKAKVILLGEHYHLQKETISVSNSGAQFKQFTIQDKNGQTAKIDGKIRTPGSGYDNINFNLDVNLNRFQILNARESRDALFFGNVMVSSEIQVRGNMDRPVIKGSATIDKGSDLSVVIPQSEAQVEQSGGIDEFIDRYPAAGGNIMTRTVAADTTRSQLRGIDLRADLTINKETTLKLFLDEQRDNYVKARGDAALIFGIDPSGKVTLTGRYEIESGEYRLVYRTVVRKSFSIQQGSNIVWVGDPLEAELDITAQYTVETDALGLLRDQMSTTNQAELNRYRQELPFWLLLNLQGELAEPNISFGIKLPPEQRGAFNGQVQAKLEMLNQASAESERNKQAFALLVLGRFLPSDISAGSGGAGSTVRNTATQLLNAQLAKLSDKYVEGVNLKLSLDSYEDYSSGEAEGRTELNVGVEKNLLNERLTVSVGGSIDLEGQRRKQQQASDLIGDISVEYQLTESGFWRLRGFRKNKYEGIIDGDIIETGASLIFSRSYNELHEIFRTPKSTDTTETNEKEPDDE